MQGGANWTVSSAHVIYKEIRRFLVSKCNRILCPYIWLKAISEKYLCYCFGVCCMFLLLLEVWICRAWFSNLGIASFQLKSLSMFHSLIQPLNIGVLFLNMELTLNVIGNDGS